MGKSPVMSRELLRQKLEGNGKFPGLSDWQKKTVLLLRCQDITEAEFLERINALYEKSEDLYESLQPESMDKESYLVGKDYYELAARSVDHYLLGLERLLDWAESRDSRALDASVVQFEAGDALTPKVMMAYLDLQDTFIDSAKAVAKSAGLDLEGIG